MPNTYVVQPEDLKFVSKEYVYKKGETAPPIGEQPINGNGYWEFDASKHNISSGTNIVFNSEITDRLESKESPVNQNWNGSLRPAPILIVGKIPSDVQIINESRLFKGDADSNNQPYPTKADLIVLGNGSNKDAVRILGEEYHVYTDEMALAKYDRNTHGKIRVEEKDGKDVKEFYMQKALQEAAPIAKACANYGGNISISDGGETQDYTCHVPYKSLNPVKGRD